MTHSLSTRLWYASTSIPPLQPGNILPVVIMLMAWIGMGYIDLAPDRAFVLSVVVAQVYVIWRNLPEAAYSIRKVKRGKAGLLIWPVLGVACLTSLQLWAMEPLLTQRIISAACLFFLVIMILGMRCERDLLDRVAPQDGSAPVERVSLLRVNALAAAVVIVVNEMLIAAEGLEVWISVMAIFVLAMHGFYWFMVLMVLPPEVERESA